MRTKQLSEVAKFISSLPDEDSAKILAYLKSLETGRTGGLVTKPLKKKVRELIVSNYRMVFFVVDETIYVVDAFRKKSQKTPVRVIERAEQILRTVEQMKKNKKQKH